MNLPKTKAELIQSHFFSAFIYPQIIEGPIIDIQNVYNNFTNIIGGITKIDKNFKKEVYERKRLGQYEVFQIIPKSLSYELTLEKVVFYNDKNKIANFISVDSLGFIKQFTPFIIEEIIKKPNNSIKEKIFYIDCWITADKVNYNLNERDTLIIKTLPVICGKLLTNYELQSYFLRASSAMLKNIILENIEL